MTRRRATTGRIQRRRTVDSSAGRNPLPRAAWIGIAGGVAAVLLIVAVLVIGAGEDAQLQADVQRFQIASRSHVQGTVPYPMTPPAGGDHASAWQNCGFYPQPIVPESGVHSLEHGAVWVTYRPDLPAEEVEALRRLASTQTFILATPFEGLASPIVASAWGRQVALESADDALLSTFIREFRQGETTPEAGAACTGGIGAPQ